MEAKKQNERQLIDYDLDYYPWEQRPDLGETDAAYQHFCVYRDMRLPFDGDGSQLYRRRSLLEVAKFFGLCKKTISRQAGHFQWKDRVLAYDLYMDRRRREHNEELALEMHANSAKIAQTLKAKALRKFATISEDEMTTNDVIKFLELGDKMERIARGESIEQPLRTEKMLVEIEALKNTGDGSNVNIIDDIPDTVIQDDIPADSEDEDDNQAKGDGA